MSKYTPFRAGEYRVKQSGVWENTKGEKRRRSSGRFGKITIANFCRIWQYIRAVIETVDQKQLFQKALSIRFCTLNWALNGRKMRSEHCVYAYVWWIYMCIRFRLPWCRWMLLLLLFRVMLNTASLCVCLVVAQEMCNWSKASELKTNGATDL